MLSNYIKIAFRNIARNKLYAVINIFGLAMGLVLYIFGGLYADYEYSHDAFFENSDRTYVLTSTFGEESNFEGVENTVVYSAVAPIFKAEQGEVEAIARTITKEYLIAVDEDKYYQQLRFADADLLKIFDFNYISGDASALNNSSGAMITKSTAEKFFKDQDVMGKNIILDHQHSFQITAIIEDLPANTHFNSFIGGDMDLEVVLPMSAYENADGDNPDENWGNLSDGNMTYVLLPENFEEAWLETQLAGLYERHYSDEKKRFLSTIGARPLIEANTAIWDMIGIPAIDVVKILGLCVLIIAIVNYTNLATAQSIGRAREVGLRKTLGAGRKQLLTQFILESITITTIAMLLALVTLEILIPSFNSATEKMIIFNYSSILPWLIATIFIVGGLSGAYPAYLITKTSPIEALRDSKNQRGSSSWIRSTMIGVQFALSVFMLAIVMVVMSQNKNVEASSNIFAKDQIFTLSRVDVNQIEGRHELLRNEMKNIRGIEEFSFSSQVPFEMYQNMFLTSRIVSEIPDGFNINQINIDPEFFTLYDIPIVAGRTISRDVALDTHVRENGKVNVVVNELATRSLGFSSPQEAIGQQFYEDEGQRGITTYTIIGVAKDTRIMGLHQKMPPYIFFMRPASYRMASIKLSENATISTIKEIEQAWKRVIPDYPIQGKFLDEHFQVIFSIFALASQSLAAFAVFALVLALIGLFGLAAFMAEQRTMEIGIRKVLGANSLQVIRLLIWQFSKPVLWATPIALALAYLASDLYLEFFDDRIGLPIGILIISGMIGLLLSWATVATHAYKVARTNPINALHHE